jgi:hypothetical protein
MYSVLGGECTGDADCARLLACQTTKTAEGALGMGKAWICVPPATASTLV